MKFTILGSTGFIGAALTTHLKAKGHEIDTPQRNIDTLAGRKLGHVIYAIGVTGNFRTNPKGTVDAHVDTLQRLMTGAEFDSWLYLSSARVYQNTPEGTEETTPIRILPSADTLYDLSKLLGESICLSHANPSVRIARLSNVYGHGQSKDTFLGSVLYDIKKTGKTLIGEAPESAKDYISIEDAVEILELIALKGQERIYNVASGATVTHGHLANIIRTSGYTADFKEGAPIRALPSINITRLKNEFKVNPRPLLEALPALLQ